MAEHRLTATSYLVLGLLSYGPATSYELKIRVAASVGNFWPFAHSQLYDEPVRLAAAGLVKAVEESGGRRRRIYHITDYGRAELRRWLGEPTPDPTEVRDLGLLKLFFGGFAGPADMAALAGDRRAAHHQRAEEYERLREELTEVADQWQLRSLELGLRFERTVEAFWADLSADLSADPTIETTTSDGVDSGE